MKDSPKFTGRPMTADVPMIGYLEGEFGKDFLQAYNMSVEQGYDNNKNLKGVLQLENNVVKGSNLYASIVAADILRESGLQLARPVDMEAARKLHESNPALGIDTRGSYVDYGLVFRSAGNPNSYHAKQIEPQIKKALHVKEITDPVAILPGDLSLVNDANSPDSLGLTLRKGAKPLVVPALKNNANFNETDKNGMPLPDKNGSRTSYTMESGLSRLGLDRSLGLDSGWSGLAGSGSGGRGVAVKR